MGEPTTTPIPDLMRVVEDAAESLAVEAGGPPAVVLDGRDGETVGVERLGDLARIIADASPEPATDRPYVSALLTYSRRAARKAVSWYVEPALGHVTSFNIALVRHLRAMLTRIDTVDRRLDSEVAQLRRELAELRAEISGQDE